MVNKNKITRACTIYDGTTEELVSLIELTSFSFSEFCTQFDVDTTLDPEMTERYSIGPDDSSFILKYLPTPIEFDFKNRAYFFESFIDDRK